MEFNPLLDVSLANMFYSLVIVFSFCWCFSLLCKTFWVWCSPICLIFFLCFLRRYISKMLLWVMFKILLLMFSSRIFMVSSLTLKFLIHFVYSWVWCKELVCFILCMYLSNFSNAIYWIDCLYPIDSLLASFIKY